MSQTSLQHMPEPPQLGDLIRFIWQRKLLLVISMLLCMLVGAAVAILSVNKYTATALVVPTQSLQGKDSLLSSQLGNIASLAGLSLGEGNSVKQEVALAKIHSKEFGFKFLQQYQLIPALIATKGWDAESDKLIFDTSVYDPANDSYTLDEDQTPLWLAFKAFNKRVDVSTEKNGLIYISFTHESPYLAKQVVENIIADINKDAKATDLKQADKSIAYLNEQLQKTELSDMRVMFYRLIEEQIKSKMLTEIQDEYIFTYVDPATLPEEKASPQRVLIIIVSLLLGAIFACFIILVQFYSRK